MNIKYNEKNYASENSIDLNKYTIKNVSFKPNKSIAITSIIISVLIIFVSSLFFVIDDNYSNYGYITFKILTSLMLFVILSALLSLRVKITYDGNLIIFKGIFKTNEIAISSIKYYFERTTWKNGTMNVYIFYGNKFFQYITYETNKSNFIFLLNLTKLGIQQLNEESFYYVKKSLRKNK